MHRAVTHRLVAAALTLGAGLIAAPSYGQGLDLTTAFDDTVEVVDVLLDVVAFDRDGEAVADLGVDDFEVREDGRRVEITGVSYYATAYDAPGGPRDRRATDAQGTELPASRYFILFFHDVRYQRAQPLTAVPEMLRHQVAAGRDSHAWVLGELQPSDWVAVVGFGKRGLHLVIDFTQDREALAEAVQHAARGGLTGLRRAADRPLRQQRPPRSGEPALRRTLDATRDLPRASRRIEDAVRLVAQASEHIVGRKNLMLFSPGFGLPGRRDTSDRAGRRSPRRPLPRLEEALNAANVAVYVLDLGGPRPRGTEAAIAEASGGAFLTGLRFRRSLESVSAENRGYYLLSYSSRMPAGGAGYRRIDVRTRDPRVTVRARHGVRFGEPAGDLSPGSR